MNVRVTSFLDGAREATGHAVIVDVFRAFTTAAFCVAAGAREVVLVADHEQALAMKREDPSLFLTGEIDGRPIPGFDVGNSPSAIEPLDLAGRRVVQRTSAGTQGVSQRPVRVASRSEVSSSRKRRSIICVASGMTSRSLRWVTTRWRRPTRTLCARATSMRSCEASGRRRQRYFFRAITPRRVGLYGSHGAMPSLPARSTASISRFPLRARVVYWWRGH